MTSTVTGGGPEGAGEGGGVGAAGCGAAGGSGGGSGSGAGGAANTVVAEASAAPVVASVEVGVLSSTPSVDSSSSPPHWLRTSAPTARIATSLITREFRRGESSLLPGKRRRRPDSPVPWARLGTIIRLESQITGSTLPGLAGPSRDTRRRPSGTARSGSIPCPTPQVDPGGEAMISRSAGPVVTPSGGFASPEVVSNLGVLRLAANRHTAQQ